MNVILNGKIDKAIDNIGKWQVTLIYNINEKITYFLDGNIENALAQMENPQVYSHKLFPFFDRVPNIDELIKLDYMIGQLLNKPLHIQYGFLCAIIVGYDIDIAWKHRYTIERKNQSFHDFIMESMGITNPDLLLFMDTNNLIGYLRNQGHKHVDGFTVRLQKPNMVPNQMEESKC